MISFIMPTLWKAIEIHNSIKLFKKIPNNDVELILIDNTNSNFIDDDPRITVIKCSKNIFVNPAWNLGVKLSKNKYICLLNDDLYFNYTTVINNFERIWSTYKNVGIIGYNFNSPLRSECNAILNNDNDELKLIDTTGTVYAGFGCCMFMEKNDYTFIDDTYKIYWGDILQIIYTIDEKRKKMYMFDNLITVGRLSVTSVNYEDKMGTEKVMFDAQLVRPRNLPRHRIVNKQKLSYD